MAHLDETDTWEEGIYQLEDTDPVQGGAEGIDNLQAKQLGNRTRWLYERLRELELRIEALEDKLGGGGGNGGGDDANPMD
jgi:hypothetical protein